MDNQDYLRFVHDLFQFNNQKNTNSNNYHYKKAIDIGCTDIYRKVERRLLVKIHCFCLMPNHYHLLVSPVVDDGIPRFMKKLNMGYAKYFNEKYDRTGALFQGKYRSVLIKADAHFLYIPYYIHFNPLDLYMPEWREGKVKNTNKALAYLEKYKWSSHVDYSGGCNFRSVIQHESLLDFFGSEEEYLNETGKQLKNFDESQVNSVALE